MTSLRAPFYATVALAAGPIVFLRGLRTLRPRRLIADTPTARIRSLAMGLVEVNGTVERRSALTAPFSGKSCAYWELDVASRTRNRWNIIHRDHSRNPFFLRDDTG